MIKNIAIIGGDLRIVKLAEMLSKDKYNIKTFGLEKAEDLYKIQNIEKSNSIKEALQYANIVIGPIPLSSDNIKINAPFSNKDITLEELVKELEGKTFIAGNIKEEFYKNVENKQIKIVDLLKREELVVLNTISTAEGAIQIAIKETLKTIHLSNVLILGYGRVGKILAHMLKQIGANVYCTARKNVDLAWIKAYGYNGIPISKLNENLNKFDIIMNTIPTLILKKEELNNIRKDCLLIDLASTPGGIDRNEAKRQGIKVIWALSLPGKVAPLTSAQYIKDTLYNVIKEI